LFKISQREISRAMRFKRPLSLLFIDIDYFKVFNDRYSYEIGDRVLQIIARCLQENVRDVDLVSRYGGEEFVILLPEMGRTDAMSAAERLREIISAEYVQTERGEVAVTVSIGVGALETTLDTDFLGPSRGEKILRELIDKAGRMLHVAKASGRNRVVVDG
jgi:diguanylate cyclase (GGDEF)-like protein